MADEILIETLREEDEPEVATLIRRNLADFDGSETVLVATFRRVKNLTEVYGETGCKFYVAKDRASGGAPIACVGLGPLHGLPSSEGMGEIRDLVVEEKYRGRGLGSRLLHLCITDAKKLGYNRLYLESSKHMTSAHRLFIKTGFRPVVGKTKARNGEGDMPSYFLMEDL